MNSRTGPSQALIAHLTAALISLAWADSTWAQSTDAMTEREFLAAGLETKPTNNTNQEQRLHLWFVKQIGDDGFKVWHRTSNDSADALFEAFEGGGRVAAVAGLGRGLYIVYADNSLQWIRFAEALPPDLPSYNATQLAPLPQAGRVVALAAHSLGPRVIVESPQSPQGVELYALSGVQWQPLSLPDEVTSQTVLGLAATGGESDELVLYTSAPKNKGIVLYRRQGLHWTAQHFEGSVAARSVPLVVAQKDLLSHVVIQSDGMTSPSLYLLRDGGMTRLTNLPMPPSSETWLAAVASETIFLTWRDEHRSTLYSYLTFPDGAPKEPSAFEFKPRPIQIPPITFILVAAVVIGMIFIMLTGRRDLASVKPQLPKGIEPAAFNRLVAACVDMAPAVAVSMVVFNVYNPVEVAARWVEQPISWDDLSPALLTIGVLVLHTTVSELFTGRTLGKWICGCRVVDIKGNTPKAWQILTRNALKVLEMLPPGAPLFLFFPLISPCFQRVGDLMGRTVVVSTLKPAEPPPPDQEPPLGP